MWKTIYPHFRFNRSVIEAYYKPFEPLFENEFEIIKKVIWCEFEPNRSLQSVVGYMDSISAYQCYLEDKGIMKGSNDDPKVQMQKVFEEKGMPDVDFITPYFAFVLKSKKERDSSDFC